MSEPASIGAMKARHHLTQLREQNDDAKISGLPEYGVVSAVSGNMVAVRAADDAGAATQLIAKAALPVIVGAVGILIPIKGGSRIFLPVGAESAPSTAFTTPTSVQISDSNALLVKTGGGTDRFRVNTSTGNVQFPNGADLRGYSDAYTSQTWFIDGSTGDAGLTDLTVASLNTPFIFAYFDETLDSTTNTSTYVDKISTSGLSLPTGTWTVRMFVMGRIASSIGGSVNVRAMIDGVAGTAVTQSGPSTGAYPVFCQQVATGVGSGARTLKVQFKGVSASTSYLSDCLVLAYFQRTA